jgi:DHA2 family multidrug resistance protein-like MFS transporter
MLIATRALLGLAGATLAPSTLSLIRSMFHDPAQRTTAIGVWVTSYSVGAAIGPPLGGVLLQHFWWGSVFLLAVPVMVLLLVVGPTLLPEFRDPDAGRMDLISAAMSLAAVLLVIYGLKKMAQDGWSWMPFISIIAGIAVGAGFVRRQRTLASPLIDLRLFRSPVFSASLATYLLATFVAFGAYIFLAQYLQLVRGLSPLQAGLWMLPWSLSFIVGSNFAPLITRRVRPGVVITAGLVVAAIGFGLITQVDGPSGFAGLMIGSVVYSFGLAPVITLATDLIVGSAPPERAGAAAAISETSSELGGALGIAILGSVGTAVYRAGMAEAVSHRVPPELAAAARGTLGGAIDVARQLPDRIGIALLETARGSFVDGLELTAVISAVVVIVTAAIAVVVLRRVPGGSRPDPAVDLKPGEAVAG